MNRTKFYILSLKINGIKNISKTLELDFYNVKISDNFDPSLYNIKAIYGENGVGKSAIISALYLTKKIVLNDKFLNQKFNQELATNLINKTTKKFEIEIEYLAKIDNEINIYSYKLVLAIKNETVFIAQETIRQRAKTKKTYTDLIDIKNGKIEYINCSNSLSEAMGKITSNLLSDNSIFNVSVYSKTFIKAIEENDSNNRKLLFAIACVGNLFFHISVFMDQNDTHEGYIIRNFISNNRKKLESIGEKAISPLISILLDNGNYELNQISVEDNIVKKENYKEFENNIVRLTKFINIFKPDLKKISIDKKINKDLYSCRIVMKYNDYDVNAEYESNGVKKLIKMFNALYSLSEGNIVFIDEIDSNIHDVYLCKLIQYFDKYSNGQLCFTTHNLSPMTLLSKRKKGIEFISRDGDVVSWSTNGNRSAINYYQNGMVDKCPFNLQYFDFLEVFEGD